MMKAFCAATAMTLMGSGAILAGESASGDHRYLIERTFPAGALDGVDAVAKRQVNQNNASLGVTWEKSYTNAEKTKTFCVYSGPSEAAVREAAKLNGLPVDSVTEIPDDIKAEAKGARQSIADGKQRYLVRRSGVARIDEARDAKIGVKLLTSYASADQRSTFWIYEAPDLASVEKAAMAGGAPIDSIAVVPGTLYPH